ncbi:hypothetical protein J6590_019125 [Homalodisca vitripennis]|nr:hypothetical protein J6590_019125 [Homalodisca vitripennis]
MLPIFLMQATTGSSDSARRRTRLRGVERLQPRGNRRRPTPSMSYNIDIVANNSINISRTCSWTFLGQRTATIALSMGS